MILLKDVSFCVMAYGEKGMKQKYLFSDYLKGIGILVIILQHSLQMNERVIFGALPQSSTFYLWMYQAVSAFVIITGFHYAASAERIGGGVTKWYDREIFIPKILRLIIPYTVMYLTWVAYALLSGQITWNWNVLFFYLQGGVGPGGYYTAVMVQILIIFPIIYYCIDRNPVYGSILLAGVDFAYELLACLGFFRESFQRLCCVRLLGGIALGILIYKGRKKLQHSAIPWILFGVGGVFLLWIAYGGYDTQIIKSWQVSSIAAVPYMGGIISYFVICEENGKGLNLRLVKSIGCLLKNMGKASYHIFLLQQLWFSIDWKYRSNFRIRYVTVIDIFLCVLFGYIFYLVESRVNCRRKR